MNKMVTLFTVYVSFSWTYTEKRHHCPDLSPLDYWFWSQCLAELRRNPTNNIQHQVLKNTINTIAEKITNEQVSKAVSDITARARCCIQVNGGAFEYKLKKMKHRL